MSKNCSINDLFPLNVSFEDPNTLVTFEMEEAVSLTDKSAVKDQISHKMVTDKYWIV